ncbi:MAG: ABC transporter ATP-binding protein [Aliishimia sp.]
MIATTQAANISAKDIGKDFGRFTALEDVSLQIGSGEFLTLLGPSGSGKTTFLMILAGFEAATRGQILLNDRDVTNVPPEERAFGMVFQGYALFPHMTVEQNIAFPLKVQRRGTVEIKRRVSEMVEMVGLGGHGHKRPSALSGGQQQRVALARALAFEPPVLLLDEPFSALDKNLRGQMQDEVRRLHREIGTTFVFVTHDQSEALALSSRVGIFDHGRLQQIGTPQQVYEQPENKFVAEFLGDINILHLNDVKSDGTSTSAKFEEQTLRAGPDAGNPSTTLAVRPEYMQMTLNKPDGGNAIAATIGELTYLGAETQLTLITRNGTPVVLSKTTANLPEGIAKDAQVWANWPENKGIFL